MTEPCAECGFDFDATYAADGIAAVRGFARRYRAPLTRFLPGEDGNAVVRERPDPATWSALEYAAHVRDVIMIWGWSLDQTLTKDRPVLPVPSQAQLDATSAAYAALDPAEVTDGLAANAERFATKAEKADDAAWGRTAQFGDDELTVLDIVRKVTHEGNHHLLDIGRVMRSVRAARGAAR